MNNIVLTGLSGSGKTSLGKRLSTALGMGFFDMDAAIAERAGMDIPGIFARFGEEYFRDLETRTAHEAAAMENTMISTGGGAVLRDENMSCLRAGGLVVFLDRPVEQIAEDICYEGRPLVAGGIEQLRELSQQRRDKYISTADMVFANEGDIEAAEKELLTWLRLHRLPAGYAVIGNPIAHSLSPPVHRAVFGDLGINDEYCAVRVARGELPVFLQNARKAGLKGFNVTSPHKRDIIPLLDKVEGCAALCGAVNTVTLRNGELCGYNTDMEGLSLALARDGAPYRGSRVVVLGAGGTAAGIALQAAQEGAAEITVLGRRPEAVRAIARAVREATGREIRELPLGEAELRAIAPGCGLLINTVPAEGAFPLDFIGGLPDSAFVCDVLYSPPRTALLQAAKNRGLRFANGLGMLIFQAVVADELYLDLKGKLDRAAAYRAIRTALAAQIEEGNT